MQRSWPLHSRMFLLFIRSHTVTFKEKICSFDQWQFDFFFLCLPCILLCLHFALLSVLELVSSAAALSVFPEDIPSKSISVCLQSELIPVGPPWSSLEHSFVSASEASIFKQHQTANFWVSLVWLHGCSGVQSCESPLQAASLRRMGPLSLLS